MIWLKSYLYEIKVRGGGVVYHISYKTSSNTNIICMILKPLATTSNTAFSLVDWNQYLKMRYKAYMYLKYLNWGTFEVQKGDPSWTIFKAGHSLRKPLTHRIPPSLVERNKYPKMGYKAYMYPKYPKWGTCGVHKCNPSCNIFKTGHQQTLTFFDTWIRIKEYYYYYSIEI